MWVFGQESSKAQKSISQNYLHKKIYLDFCNMEFNIKET